MTAFGLSEEVIEDIKNVLEKYPDVKWAKIFGSRAKGNYKPNSDIDISLGGIISQETLGLIAVDLDELQNPYKFDINSYETINHNQLKDHIDRVGITFYSLNQ